MLSNLVVDICYHGDDLLTMIVAFHFLRSLNAFRDFSPMRFVNEFGVSSRTKKI